jgi:STE24 endopeptidase
MGCVYTLEDDFTPEQIERSRARKRDVLPLRLTSAALDLGVVCVLGFTGLGAALIHAVGTLGGGGWAAVAALGAVTLNLLLTLLTLPVAARFEVVNRGWGLSNRTWALFWTDTAKGFLLGAIFLAAVSVGLYGALRALPGTWWIAAALAAAALVFVLSFILPVVVEPLFNRFTPLPDGPLRDQLTAVATRSGVTVRDILVSDASRRTNSVNAYVSGMGRTRRIVVWDTTVELTPAEGVAAITAHELGHAARRDVLTATTLAAGGVVLATAALAGVLHWKALLRTAGLNTAADPRSLALVLAIATVLGTLGTPLFNAHSRHVEARADRYALDLTRDPVAVIATWRDLAVHSIADLDPHPLNVAWFGTHPPIPARIAHARAWAAEHGVPVSADPGGTDAH